TYNMLIGRYPGADGLKTVFICASGFNLVASATRDGRRLIAVVLGAPSSAARALKAAQLLERGFNSNTGLAWLMPSLGTVESLQPINAEPPNLRDEMCGGHRKRPATEDEDDSMAVTANSAPPTTPHAISPSACARSAKGAPRRQETHRGEPVLVYPGAKPPPPGTVQAGWGEPKAKHAKKKTATAKLTKDKDGPKEGASSAA